MTRIRQVGDRVLVKSALREPFVGIIEEVRPHPPADPYWWGYTVAGWRTFGGLLEDTVPKAERRSS